MTRRAFLVLFTLAALLRLPLLAAPLWYDEAFTLLLARLPLERMFTATAGDVHPPLWYLVEWALFHLWPALPNWAARLPALAASLACLPVLRQVLKPAAPRLQWLALGLLAVSPLQISFASEARMYSLLCLEVLLAFWMIQSRRWPWFCLTLVALVYTHNYGLFYAAALGLAALIIQPKDFDRAVSACLLTGVCWLPQGLTLLAQMQTIDATYWMVEPVTWQRVLLMIYQSIFRDIIDPLGIAVLLSALLIGVWIQRRNYALLVMAFLPLGLGLLVSLFWQSILLPRALIGSSPFLLIALAAALERAWPAHPRDLRRALVAAIGLVPIFILGWRTLYAAPNKSDFGGQVRQVLAQVQPGDVIAFWGVDLQVTWSLTDPTIGKRAVFVSPCKQIRGGLSQATRAALGYNVRRWDQVHAPRVWLVTAESPFVAQCTLEEQRAAAQGARLVSRVESPTQLATIQVWLVEER